MDHQTTQHPGRLLPILQVGNVLVSPDVLTEFFCCDYEKCKGACCIEGNAGAPVCLDEIGEIEDSLDAVWGDLSASAQSIIDRQGVAYSDPEGELVTSIVHGKDCVFTCYEGESCLCALEKACREGRSKFQKPISCALYPIRAKQFSNGSVGLNYHRWDICRDAVEKGRQLNLRVYEFLREPLVRRFGQQWYDELCQLVSDLREQGFLDE